MCIGLPSELSNTISTYAAITLDPALIKVTVKEMVSKEPHSCG